MSIKNLADTSELFQKLREENVFNKYTEKQYYVNQKNEVVIKGIMSRLILSEVEQEMLLKDIKNIIMRKTIGDEISFLESLALTMILDGTY